MRNKLRRPLALLLSAVMIVTMSGTPVHAVADRGQPETGLCEHHAAHTDDCGYTEETPGTPCGHEHTEDCYTEVTECVHEHTPECYPEETEDSVSDNEATPANAEEREPENCPHICDGESGCITEKLDCRHEHKVNGGEADREGGLGRDSECGYTESTPGTPCTYVCEICNPQDSGEADEEPETGIIKQEHCSCLTLCTEGQINPDCLVCGAENAGLSDCKGKAEKEDTKQPEDTGICKHHQEHDDACGYQPESEDSEGSPCTYECRICPIEDLIAALPDKVTEDNAEDVRARLDKILALFAELTEDEQGQIDLSRCYELQGALDGANDPMPLATGNVVLTYVGQEISFTVDECGNNCQGHTITQNVQSGVVQNAKILVESGTHNITFSGLNLRSAAVGIMPGGTMNLTLVGTNKIVGSGRGFYVPVGATLVITEQSTGSLDISLTNSTTAAGIGGAYYDPNGNDGDFSCGMVVINGGTITAAGRGDSAGIGGASYAPNFGNGGNITITGGHVTATGSDGAPGIGGGKDADSDGSLTLSSADVLAENTTLGAKGTYTINGDPTEDMIVVPELVYTGEILDTSEIRIDDSKTGTATYFGQTFRVQASADGWVLQDLGEVKEGGEYTAVFKKGNKEISKTFTVAQSGTQFVGDGTVKTYKDGAACSDFTASDTITVKATPTATGQAPAKAAARLRGDPTAGQMVVFVGDTQVCAPADVGADGSYTMNVSAADVLVAAGGPGTGITLTAKFVGNDNMADGAGTVDVSISAVAKIENGSATTYVGESGLDAAFNNSDYAGATFTLLANVTRATTLRIKINCTLDLNGHNIKSTNETCLSVDGSVAVTIQGEGEIISEQIYALVVIGSVTLEGGTFTSNKGDCGGVYVNYGTLSVIGENVVIQNTSNGGYGLAVNNARSVQLSGGKYSGTAGAISIVGGSLTLGDLLGHSDDTRYAYFDESGTTPFTGVLGNKSLTGTVTVKKCNHTGEGVCEYTPNEGAETHAMTCLACGYAGAAEDCQYTYTPDSGGEHHITACQFCGRAKTEAHTYGSWTPEHNENAVTIRRSCENCGYTKTDGTFTAPAPGQTMQYGKPITLTCSSTLPGATFSWSLIGSTAEGTGASFTLPETLAVGSYLYHVTVKWPGSESNICTEMDIFEVTPAPLTATGATAEGRAYDGTNSVEITGVTLAGILNGDDVSVDTTGLTGTLNGSNAGTYTNLTLPAMTLTGADAENYTVTRPAGAVPASVTIRKAAPLTPKTGDLAVANKQEHTYTYGLGALRPDVPEGISLGSTAVTYELGTVSLGSYYDSGAMIDGQTLTLPIKAVESDSETKIGTITVTIHTQNFEDMTATIDVRSVNKQSVDISGVTLTGRTYNGSPIEYQQTATASVDGKTVNVNGFVYTWDTPNHAAPVNAGNYTLTVSVDPEDRNYTGSTTIPVVIEQAEIRVTAPSKTIYVGETAPVFSAADCNITGLVQGENLKTPPTVAYAEAPDTSKTGSVTVTASGAEVPEGGNYKDRIVYENGTLTITSKPLPPAKYTVTVQAGTGGTASASPTSAEKGTKITLNATPDGGYHFKEWQVISGGVTISNNSFTMPAANVTVKAVFERNSNGGGNSGGSGGGGGSSSGGGSSNGNNGSSGGGSTIVARPDETKPDTPTTSQTKPATPDKNGNVAVDNGTVQSAINTAKNDAKKNGNTANGVAVVIPVTPKEGQNSFNVTINAQTLNTLVREKVKRLEINIEGVVVGGMDTKLLKWLDTLSANGDVIFRVKKTDPSGLSKEAKAAIGTRPVYDLSLVYLSGGKETPITDFDGHTIAVRLPYAPAKDEKTGNLYAVYVDGKGKVEWLTKSSYDPDLGTVVFETGHFSIYGIGYKNPVPVFTDIKNHWAEDNIIFVASRGLLAGTGNNQFSPDTGMTRGMFVTALGRLAGIDQADYKTGKFTDVKADAYYAPYVNWAAEKGIVNGTSATTFSPDTNITREQMAVIMANYAKKLGYDLPVAHDAVTFADNAQISGWAAKEVKAMQQAGIMAGKGGNRFDPKGTATRAEVATVLRRFVEIVIDPQTAQGWMQNHSGSWQYMKNGKPATGWLQDDKKWYWLDSNGWMFTGGWKQIDGKWYYFYSDGSMAVNTTIDGYAIGSDGARK